MRVEAGENLRSLGPTWISRPGASSCFFLLDSLHWCRTAEEVTHGDKFYRSLGAQCLDGMAPVPRLPQPTKPIRTVSLPAAGHAAHIQVSTHLVFPFSLARRQQRPLVVTALKHGSYDT